MGEEGKWWKKDLVEEEVGEEGLEELREMIRLEGERSGRDGGGNGRSHPPVSTRILSNGRLLTTSRFSAVLKELL